jgi:non-specific serine/threonine protein kinase
MPEARSAHLLASAHTFGDLLRSLRRRARLTQRELSIAVGYSEGQISRLEHNERPPDLATVAGLFLPALDLDDEPEVAARLIELAAVARGEARPGQVTYSRREEPAGENSRVSLSAPLGNLSLALSSFVGREQAVADVGRLLATARLVTLTGAGGSGKTRLAQQVAAQAASGFRDGVWWVELAPLSDPALLVETVAAALNVRAAQDVPLLACLTEALRPRQLLLVLDNCEHLVSAAAELAAVLLGGCPALHLLATSRESLNLPGETVYLVPPLSLPADLSAGPERLLEAESVRLFVDRAQAGLPSFALTPATASAVAQICTRLDGIPLAIELAAARVKVLPVEAIAARLQDRFTLLKGGSRTALPRQQSLAATLDWSYELLSQPERALFHALSVFAGSFSLEAVEAVAAGAGLGQGASLDLLTSLVNKSLVFAVHGVGSEARYQLLETMRQYAAERLAATEALGPAREAHLDYYLSFVEQAEGQLRGPEQVVWFNRLAREHDNARAALALAWEIDLARAVRLVWALTHFWFVRGHWQEQREWRQKLLFVPSLPRNRAGVALRGWLAAATPAEAAPRFEEALVLADGLGDLSLLAELRGWQGEAAWWRAPDTARARFEEAVALYRQAGEPARAAYMLAELGELVQVQHEDRITARACFAESLALCRALNDKRGMAKALVHLGDVAMEQGDLAVTRAACAEGFIYAHELGDLEGEAWALNGLGIAAMGEGKFDEAVALNSQSLALSEAYASSPHIVIRRYWLAASLWRRGDAAEAARLHELNLVASRSMDFDWGLGISHYGLGEVNRTQGDQAAASDFHRQALVVFRQMRDRSAVLAYALDAHAYLAAAPRPSAAAQLLGAADAMRRAVAAALLPVEAASLERVAMTLRANLGEEMFAAGYSAGQALGTDQAITLALAAGAQ